MPLKQKTDKPVAWAIVWGSDDADTVDTEFVFDTEDGARFFLKHETVCRGRAVPLYRNPQPSMSPRERKAIAFAAKHISAVFANQAKAILGFLERQQGRK